MIFFFFFLRGSGITLFFSSNPKGTGASSFFPNKSSLDKNNQIYIFCIAERNWLFNLMLIYWLYTLINSIHCVWTSGGSKTRRAYSETDAGFWPNFCHHRQEHLFFRIYWWFPVYLGHGKTGVDHYRQHVHSHEHTPCWPPFFTFPCVRIIMACLI